MPRFFLIAFFFLLSVLGNFSPAQSPQDKYFDQKIEQHQFDDKKYNSLTEGLDYSEEKKEKEEKKETDPKQFEGLGPVFKFVIIILGIALLLFFLIKALTGENIFLPKNKKVKPAAPIDLEKIEENLEAAELDDPIKQAIAAGDYPLAVRLYYLSVLKELSLQKKIAWKKDKTNGEYLRELAGSDHFKTVQELTVAFEKIWYGKVEISEQDFRLIEPRFIQTIKEITPQKN